MNYGEIKKIDIANGEGVRVSLFVSGCRVHCPGCFNTCTWNFNYGKLWTEETENEIIEALKKEYINGLTILGGEPFEPENQKVLAPFLNRIKKLFPTKSIWCYSGYLFDKDIQPKNGRKHTEWTDSMLECIDILVDGPFILAERDISLQFRGSRNQRILNLKAMRSCKNS